MPTQWRAHKLDLYLSMDCENSDEIRYDMILLELLFDMLICCIVFPSMGIQVVNQTSDTHTTKLSHVICIISWGPCKTYFCTNLLKIIWCNSNTSKCWRWLFSHFILKQFRTTHGEKVNILIWNWYQIKTKLSKSDIVSMPN